MVTFIKIDLHNWRFIHFVLKHYYLSSFFGYFACQITKQANLCLFADTYKRSSMKKTHDEKLHKFLLKKKTPLTKSLSMPDIENRMKKRERLLA